MDLVVNQSCPSSSIRSIDFLVHGLLSVVPGLLFWTSHASRDLWHVLGVKRPKFKATVGFAYKPRTVSVLHAPSLSTKHACGVTLLHGGCRIMKSPRPTLKFPSRCQKPQATTALHTPCDSCGDHIEHSNLIRNACFLYEL